MTLPGTPTPASTAVRNSRPTRSRRRRRSVAATVLATVVASAAASGADAAKIVHSCDGPDLCATDPVTGLTVKVTTDGATAAGAYSHPSISRDGRRLAAARGSDVVVGDYGANLTQRWTGSRSINDVALAPDASGVAESHSYVENVYGCPFTGGCLRLVDRSATDYSRGVEAEGNTRSHDGGGGVGFLGGGALLSSYYTRPTAAVAPDTHSICIAADPLAEGCEPRITSSDTLSSPAGSPDGRLIAVAVTVPGPPPATSVRLFDAATGAPIRTLADRAGSPAFSPDGRAVAYAAADGWIHVVATAGGRARRLVRGHSPTWGDGSAPGAAVSSTALRYARSRIAVRLRCTGPAPCAGTLRIAKGRTPLGSRGYRIAAGSSATVRVKPSDDGAQAIGARQTVAVVVAPKGAPAGATTRLTLRAG